MHNEKIYDCLVVGFGPAAIALAIHFYENAGLSLNDLSRKIIFLEKNIEPGWHSDLLIPNAFINHHYLTDLITPVNPKSEFSFVNYLFEQKKLYEFCYLDNMVSRKDWENYIVWAASKLSPLANYGCNVEQVSLSHDGNIVNVKTDDNLYRCKNLILAHGLEPNIPNIFKPLLSDTLFHASGFLRKIKNIDRNKSWKFAVIGSGQTAAEIVLYLREKYDNSLVYSTHSAVGFKLKDTGHTSNRIYFPEEIDYFYPLSHEAKLAVFKDTTSADYGNVSRMTSHDLQRRMYDDLLNKEEKIIFKNRVSVKNLNRINNEYVITLEDPYTKKKEELDVDVIICCTGYCQPQFPRLLEKIKSVFPLNENNGLILSRDYQAITHPELSAGFYMLGISEHVYGISDTQSFSIMSKKVARISNSLILIITKSLQEETEFV